MLERLEGIELCESIGKRAEIAAANFQRNHLHARKSLRRHRARRRMPLSGKWKVIRSPISESVGQFAPARGSIFDRYSAGRMPGANHAVGRGRHDSRREPRGPLVEYLMPRAVLEFVAEELEPILGAASVAERGTPIFVREPSYPIGTRCKRTAVALEPRHHGSMASHRAHRFNRHRSVIGETVIPLGTHRRPDF